MKDPRKFILSNHSWFAGTKQISGTQETNETIESICAIDDISGTGADPCFGPLFSDSVEIIQKIVEYLYVLVAAEEWIENPFAKISRE